MGDREGSPVMVMVVIGVHHRVGLLVVGRGELLEADENADHESDFADEESFASDHTNDSQCFVDIGGEHGCQDEATATFLLLLTSCIRNTN